MSIEFDTRRHDREQADAEAIYERWAKRVIEDAAEDLSYGSEVKVGGERLYPFTFVQQILDEGELGAETIAAFLGGEDARADALDTLRKTVKEYAKNWLEDKGADCVMQECREIEDDR